MCTTTTAAVSGPMAAATASGASAIVSGSQSTKRIRPPAARAAAAVAKNVFAGTSTSRSVTPIASSAICSALVPELTATP